jgi:hypothetical protein
MTVALALFAIPSIASAQDVVRETRVASFSNSGSTSFSTTSGVNCPQGSIAIAGGIHVAEDPLPRMVVTSSRDGTLAGVGSGWRSTLAQAKVTPGTGTAQMEYTAVCVREEIATCLTPIEAESSVITSPEGEVSAVAVCPAGEFLVGGGGYISESWSGIDAITALHPSGLLLPTAQKITAKRIDPTQTGPFSAVAVGFCAPAHLVPSLTVVSGALPQPDSVSAPTGYSFDRVGTASLAISGETLTGGMRSGAPNYLLGAGYDDGLWTVSYNEFALEGEPEAPASYRAVQTPDLERFGRDLDCDAPSIDLDPGPWTVGNAIWLGVSVAGSGVYIIPGRSPDPIAPLGPVWPLARILEEASSAVVVAYDSPDDAERQLAELYAGFEQEGLELLVLESVAEALEVEAGVVLVTVPSEEALETAAWLETHREAFVGRESLVLFHLPVGAVEAVGAVLE